MGKSKIMIPLVFILITLMSTAVYAMPGDIGFFGGITEGRRLPKTTEMLLQSTRITGKTQFIYKEEIFLGGIPVEFEGYLTVTPSGANALSSASGLSANTLPLMPYGTFTASPNAGQYNVTYTVTASDVSNPRITLSRNIVFTVFWRQEGRQIIKDYTVSSWTETLTPGPAGDLDGNTYTLKVDPRQSYFNVSIIEDRTAAVTYYRGDISQKAVYITSDTEQTISEVYGSFYGYDCAWSSTETHRLDGTIYKKRAKGSSYEDVWQMQYQVRPSVSVAKSLQYTENEPTLISFEGNYKEVLSNESGLVYDIFITPLEYYNANTNDAEAGGAAGSPITKLPLTGGATIDSINEFEQLIEPDVSYLKGHYAERDIKRLFALQVLEGPPKYYIPNQAITRGQYTTAVIKALKVPLQGPSNAMLFPDVLPDNQYYSYVMTAYQSGIAIGRSNGRFYADSPLDRQEAIVILLRSLGLENLGLDPTPVTLFADDAQIASWAKREIYAAERIGLISQDEDGKIKPKAQVTKAEAAALINNLINYMRSELQRDYTDHIVDIVF